MELFWTTGQRYPAVNGIAIAPSNMTELHDAGSRCRRVNTFGYACSREVRTVVTMDVHGEFVVATVEKEKTQRVVDGAITVAKSKGLPFE
jgi:hypothetical protein